MRPELDTQIRMEKYTLTPEDLFHSLEEQLYFLDSSLTNYSEHKTIKKYENKVLGKHFNTELKTEIEAKRIATIVRILLHDTTNSTSLLKLLGIKDTISYLDTSAPNDGRLHSMTGMSGVRGSNSNQYLGLVAKINTGGSLIATPLYRQHLEEWYQGYLKLNFADWWGKEIINIKGHKHTRSNLILTVANQDGGAHIHKDKTLPSEYYATKNSNLTLNIQGVETEFERNIVYASIAQIGWELLNSIDNDTK
jgi:hypothetical protein